MQRNMRHTCRVMLREAGPDIKKTRVEKWTHKEWQAEMERGRGLHTERHTEKVNMRRHACAHAQTHIQK
jgi:hypothetical protein